MVSVVMVCVVMVSVIIVSVVMVSVIVVSVIMVSDIMVSVVMVSVISKIITLNSRCKVVTCCYIKGVHLNRTSRLKRIRLGTML